MTERDLYDAALIEINKLEAPSMLLEDYNYFINKAIQQYINKAYNRYEINQQATDDLGALKVSAVLDVVAKTTEDKDGKTIYAEPSFPGESKTYYCVLPQDYWHALSCLMTFNKTSTINKCDSQTGIVTSPVRKLTSDVMPTIMSNAYFKPSYKTPYYSIKSSSSNDDLLEEIIDPCGTDYSDDVVINLFCGDDSKRVPNKLYFNYLKIPKKIELKEDDLYGEYEVQMEFPDYICYEIINEFVKLLLENTADPRLSTNVPINQSIIGEISEE